MRSESHSLTGLAHKVVEGRYALERELGSGAFGTVYAARDTQSGELAALKQLSRLLEGGDVGRDKREQALALAAAQGFQTPRRGLAMNCPVIDSLEAKSP